MSLLDLFVAGASCDPDAIASAVRDMQKPAVATGSKAGNAPASSASSSSSSSGSASSAPTNNESEKGCGFDAPGIGRCVRHVDGTCTLQK